MRTKAFSIFVIVLVLLTPCFVWGAPKDTLIIAQGVDATTLDIHNQNEEPTNNICINIFDSLFQRTAELKIVPLLAVSYKMVDDTTWEISLRKGVKFHNGEDFNATVVKFNLERVADPRNKLRQTLLQIIDRVDILDDYTVRITTKQPYPLMIPVLCGAGAAVHPPKYFQEKGLQYIASNPVGTGPYGFVRWVKGDHILLEANEKYWRGAPEIKKVIFRPIPEATTRIAGLQTQELDIIVNIPPHLMRLVDWKGRSFVSKAPSTRAIYVAFDTMKGGPVADKRVRRAIAQAVDMEGIIRKVLNGNGILLGMNFTKEQFGYDPTIKPYAYNPEQAKKLLVEAGYPQGFDFVLHSPIGRYLNDKEVAEAIVGDLQKIGINASFRGYEFGTFVSKWTAHNLYPAYLAGWGNTLFDATGTTYSTLHTGQPFSNYSNPQLDALITQGRATMDAKERQKISFEACKLIKEEVPTCLNYQQIDIYGVNERVNWKARKCERLYVFDMSFKK
jgi:peptide/nickel transport system substrate-binding protein